MPRLALLFICRQIYQEAHDLYYTPDYFCFTKADSMLDLLFEAGWADRPDMDLARIFPGGRICERLQSYEEAKYLWEALRYLVHCKYLRRLKIFIEEDWQQGSSLCSDFMQPFGQLEGVDVVVNCWIPREWDSWAKAWVSLGEVCQWRLTRCDAGAQFEAEDGEDGNADDGGGDFWSQRAVRIVPLLQIRRQRRDHILRW